jgi:hypothetical protein
MWEQREAELRELGFDSVEHWVREFEKAERSGFVQASMFTFDSYDWGIIWPKEALQ